RTLPGDPVDAPIFDASVDVAVRPDVPFAIDAPAPPDLPPPPPPDAPEVPDARPCVVECIDADNLRSCPGEDAIACPLGCVGGAAPHCATQIVSNGVPPNLTDGTSGLTVPAGTTYIVSTDVGLIVSGTGGIVRAPGTGVVAGIGFFRI